MGDLVERLAIGIGIQETMTAETSPLTQPAEATEFQTGQITPVVAAHLIHDIYTASVAPLLPLIIEKLSLTLTQAGLLTSFLQFPGVLNPIFGYIADKVSIRFFLILAPAVTGTAISLVGLASNYFAVAFLFFVAGVSTAAFHAPAPALIGRSARQTGAAPESAGSTPSFLVFFERLYFFLKKTTSKR